MPLDNLFTYQIEKNLDGMVLAKLNLDPNHRIYAGHFPGNPVTPGVCLVEMVRKVLSDATGSDLRLTGAKDIKFKSAIVPPFSSDIELKITFVSTENGIEANCSISDKDTLFTKIRGTFSEG